MKTQKIILPLILIVFLGVLMVTFLGCDANYVPVECSYSVVGEGGCIANDMKNDSSIIVLNAHPQLPEIKFTALPHDGYKVKEWKYNGEVVKDNKSNIFALPSIKASKLDYEDLSIKVIVEFELKDVMQQ